MKIIFQFTLEQDTRYVYLHSLFVNLKKGYYIYALCNFIALVMVGGL